MSFKAKKYRDVFKRRKAAQKELVYGTKLALINNQLAPEQLRQQLFNAFVKSHKRTAVFARAKNRCLVTNRSKSVIRFFRMSRITFREKARAGQLLGVKRSSW